MFRLPVLRASLATSALVATVIMATMVVRPFYLSLVLGLDAALVGLALSIGPIAASLTAVPAGRIADQFGAPRVTTVGLIGMAVGSFMLSMLPATLGIPGYVVPIAVVTAGSALFQTANNTTVMTGISPDKRGVISGMLTLPRNLGSYHRRISHGRCIRTCIGDERYHYGVPRGRCHWYADHIRSRGDSIIVALAIVAAPYRRILRNRKSAS